MLPGRGGRGMPMPWLDANGLLPGRGPPGLGPPGFDPEAGFAAPGFPSADFAAPGFCPPGFISASASAAGDAGSAAGCAGAASAGAGASGSGFGAGFGPGFGAPAAFLAAGFAAASPSPWALVTPSASRAALTLRATGGAMLDEDALTNSPISLSLARTTLLSTPISAAISCTRGFATFLLSGFTPDRREPLISRRASL